MSLLVVIAVVWFVVLVFTMALLRMAAMADADADAERQERLRLADDRLRERAPSAHRFAGSRERTAAGR